jgi:cobalt/nickel transport system permease protein
MHMADALISPAVGGTLWAVTAGMIVWCASKVKQACDDRLVPMMGVLGAFIFTAQMINFSIPATGSSGHLGGGLILAALLGPYAAFLVIASVLSVQALFFADGGLLALGCNIFNLGFFSAFIAYPLIYRAIAKEARSGARLWTASILAAVVGLQLGAFSVVLETTASGISDLPFGSFVWLMLPIHLAIGVVEGLATAAVVVFIARARPEALVPMSGTATKSLRPVLTGLLMAAVLLGAVVSWFASSQLDGLEWSIGKTTGHAELKEPDRGIHAGLAGIQEQTAFLPDYGFKTSGDEAVEEPAAWPAVHAGTSVAGIVGGLITLVVAALIGYCLKARRTAKSTV